MLGTGEDHLRYNINLSRIGRKFMNGVMKPTKHQVIRILILCFDPLLRSAQLSYPQRHTGPYIHLATPV